MNRILVTGATGNIGLEVISSLAKIKEGVVSIAAVRNIEKARTKLGAFPKLEFRKFDFEDGNYLKSVFREIDILFLLRPPNISDVDKYFKPLLKSAKENGVENIIFLSVQGAEKSKVIPHNKIEKLITELHFNYIFVRPSYFMQNLTTTLLPEIKEYKTITLPSGKAKFNWIDVRNIGEVVALLSANFESYRNRAMEITGTENKNFYEVSALLSELTETSIKFNSVNPLSFYFKKKSEGIPSAFAMVMTILHFIPRLQKEPQISDNYKIITGNNPTCLREFILREMEKFREAPAVKLP